MTTAVSPRRTAARAPARDRRPTTMGYWLAGALAAVGAAVALAWAGLTIVAVNDHVAGFARVSIPGQMSVVVDEPGTQYVYYEGDGDPTLADLGVSVTGPVGQTVAVKAYDNGVEYDGGTRVGHSIATFEADAAGRYFVAVIGGRPDEAVAVGDSYAKRILPTLAGAGAVLVATAVGAIVLVGVTYRRRLRAGVQS